MAKLLSLSAIEPLLTIRITLLNGYSFKNIMQMTAKFAVVGCIWVLTKMFIAKRNFDFSEGPP